MAKLGFTKLLYFYYNIIVQLDVLLNDLKSLPSAITFSPSTWGKKQRMEPF